MSVFPDQEGGYAVGNILSATNEGVAVLGEFLGILLLLLSLINLLFFFPLRRRHGLSKKMKLVSTFTIVISICWFLFCLLIVAMNVWR
jgi:hypothetical protein